MSFQCLMNGVSTAICAELVSRLRFQFVPPW
jgi:hypothetical protein